MMFWLCDLLGGSLLAAICFGCSHERQESGRWEKRPDASVLWLVGWCIGLYCIIAAFAQAFHRPGYGVFLSPTLLLINWLTALPLLVGAIAKCIGLALLGIPLVVRVVFSYTVLAVLTNMVLISVWVYTWHRMCASETTSCWLKPILVCALLVPLIGYSICNIALFAIEMRAPGSMAIIQDHAAIGMHALGVAIAAGSSVIPHLAEPQCLPLYELHPAFKKNASLVALKNRECIVQWGKAVESARAGAFAVVGPALDEAYAVVTMRERMHVLNEKTCKEVREAWCDEETKNPAVAATAHTIALNHVLLHWHPTKKMWPLMQACGYEMHSPACMEDALDFGDPISLGVRMRNNMDKKIRDLETSHGLHVGPAEAKPPEKPGEVPDADCGKAKMEKHIAEHNARPDAMEKLILEVASPGVGGCKVRYGFSAEPVMAK